MAAINQSLPKTEVRVDATAVLGSLEQHRHTVGHGGINTVPLPPRVVDGVRKLQPRLIRIFLQEFFQVFTEHRRFDWDRLDPYMDAFARTGAKIVAAICIKPRALFPEIDQDVWQPADVAEWQRLIYELVWRYSVEKPLVTHWEIGNETDIGEDGGCPYLIRDPDDYLAYYKMTIKPILEAFPAAKVGGPAAASIGNEPLPGLVARCRQEGVPLDFISWHLYSNDPQRHAAGVEKAKALLEGFPDPRPEMMITEWSCGFPSVSLEELAFDPQRAAITAASILTLMEAGLDWSFYYHLWDQVCYPEEFQPFFSEKGVANMVTHWNEIPHRFGLFGVNEEVRPQYFVYQMLSRMGSERIAVQSEAPDLRLLAARNANQISLLMVNLNMLEPQDRAATARFSHLQPGRKVLTVYRIDAERRWNDREMELLPIERREVSTLSDFYCQVLCPADSVVLLTLENKG